LPLFGIISLTYRCNNQCPHCWTRLRPEDVPEKDWELSLDEIQERMKETILQEGSEMIIWGGEPMLRPDFGEILNFFSKPGLPCHVITNGTLITAEIAKMFKDIKGSIRVTIFGSTAEMHDGITCIPGSFESAIHGINYLKEAGMNVLLRIVPLKENLTQLNAMIFLAEALGLRWVMGNAFLPSPLFSQEGTNGRVCQMAGIDFHLDPYGKRTSLKGRIPNKMAGCSSCQIRDEHQPSPSWTKVCPVIKDNLIQGEKRKDRLRYFKIADLTIKFEAELFSAEKTFHPDLELFAVSGKSSPPLPPPVEGEGRLGNEMVSIRHYFNFPELMEIKKGEKLYDGKIWRIYKKNGAYLYEGLRNNVVEQLTILHEDEAEIRTYSLAQDIFLRGGIHSVSLFTTDQFFLIPILAKKEGCYLHAAGVIIHHQGLAFIGTSGAGKSTLVSMFKGKGEILCDDRVIVRKRPEGYKIYGNWSHGDIPEISPAGAPLKALVFLNQAEEDRLELIQTPHEAAMLLIGFVIRAFPTSDWWEQILLLIENMVTFVPCYRLHFRKKIHVLDLLEGLCTNCNILGL